MPTTMMIRFIHIRPLISKKISRHATQVLTDGRLARRPENVLPPPWILRWQRHKNIQIWRLAQADVQYTVTQTPLYLH